MLDLLVTATLAYLLLGVIVVGIRWKWSDLKSSRVDGGQSPAPTWQTLVWWIIGVRR